MIISANRFSTMNGNIVFAANESYGMEDIGRILIENEMNDMAIFNAVLKSDMYELKARNEGTLLESELQALSEESKKNFIHTIIGALQRVWAKIKGVFKNAYANIAAFAMRNGKPFLNQYKEALAQVDDSTKLKGKHWGAKEGSFVNIADKFGKTFRTTKVTEIVKSIESMGNTTSSADVTKAAIQKFLGDSSYSDGNVYKHMKEAYFKQYEDPTIGELGGKKGMMDVLGNGSELIRGLKKAESTLEAGVKASIKDLQAAAKKLDTDEGKKDAKFYKMANSAYTNGMSTVASAAIKLAKFEFKVAHTNLLRAVGAASKAGKADTELGESALLESMIMEAEDDVDAMSDNVSTEPGGADLNPEEQEVFDALMDAIDERIEEEKDGSSDEGTTDESKCC